MFFHSFQTVETDVIIINVQVYKNYFKNMCIFSVIFKLMVILIPNTENPVHDTN